MARGRSYLLQDNFLAVLAIGLAAGFVLWQQKQKKTAIIQGVIGAVKVTRKKPRPYIPRVTPLQRQLDDCQDAYDELSVDFTDATGREPKRYDDPTVIDVGVSRNPKHLRPGDVEGYQRFTTMPTVQRQQVIALMNPHERAALQATLNRAAQYLRKKRVTVGNAPNFSSANGTTP